MSNPKNTQLKDLVFDERLGMIAVIGGRAPKWLDPEDLVFLHDEGPGQVDQWMTVSDVYWHNIDRFGLPAGHWAVAPLLANFTPWRPRGLIDTLRPEDWDGGPVVVGEGLGSAITTDVETLLDPRWGRLVAGEPSGWQIRGYTRMRPVVEAPEQLVTEDLAAQELTIDLVGPSRVEIVGAIIRIETRTHTVSIVGTKASIRAK